MNEKDNFKNKKKYRYLDNITIYNKKLIKLEIINIYKLYIDFNFLSRKINDFN